MWIGLFFEKLLFNQNTNQLLTHLKFWFHDLSNLIRCFFHVNSRLDSFSPIILADISIAFPDELYQRNEKIIEESIKEQLGSNNTCVQRKRAHFASHLVRHSPNETCSYSHAILCGIQTRKTTSSKLTLPCKCRGHYGEFS